MIAYVKGTLEYISDKEIIVETGGIGYMIIVPSSVIERLPSVGNDVTIYTYMAVREDAMLLYGFLERDDEKMFEKLITVSGIGPKGAVGILSVLTPDELRFAILSDDVKTISKAPGIGAKTAGRLVLELKDKIDLAEAFELKSAHEADGHITDGLNDASGNASGVPTSVKNEAIQALVVLGYSRSEALKAVGRVSASEDIGVEELLKLALKSL